MSDEAPASSGVEDGRTQVGEQFELLADASRPRSGTLVSGIQCPTSGRRRRPAAAHRPVGQLTVASGSGWPWRHRGTADKAINLEIDSLAAQRLSTRRVWSMISGIDAVTRQNTDFIDFSVLSVGRTGARSTAGDQGKQPGWSMRRRASKSRIFGVTQGQADVVPAVEQAFTAERVHLEGTTCHRGGDRPGVEIDASGSRFGGVALGNSASTSSAASLIGSRPFLKQLLKKMSAKLGPIMAEPEILQRPRCVLAEEPQPKLSRVSRICAPGSGLVKHEVRV